MIREIGKPSRIATLQITCRALFKTFALFASTRPYVFLTDINKHIHNHTFSFMTSIKIDETMHFLQRHQPKHTKPNVFLYDIHQQILNYNLSYTQLTKQITKLCVFLETINTHYEAIRFPVRLQATCTKPYVFCTKSIHIYKTT